MSTTMHLAIVAVFWSVVVIAFVLAGLTRRRRHRASAAERWDSRRFLAKNTRTTKEK